MVPQVYDKLPEPDITKQTPPRHVSPTYTNSVAQTTPLASSFHISPMLLFTVELIVKTIIDAHIPISTIVLSDHIQLNLWRTSLWGMIGELREVALSLT